jgi:glycosyltransferase involved in cell wall biosynthesis
VNIAFVYDAVYPENKGGAERRYVELAVELARLGHEVHYYTMRAWDGPRDVDRHGVHYHGVCRPRPLYTATGRRSISEAMIFGLACLRLVGTKHDTIDCCGFPFFSLFAAKVAALVSRARLVSTWHEVWGHAYWVEYLCRRIGPIGAVVERLCSRLPSQIIAVSPETAARVEAIRRRGDVVVVPNGVDLALISSSEISAERCDIVCVGRLLDFKNIELLIDAVGLLARDRWPIRCRIVGDGPHRAALESKVRTDSLEDAIIFEGFLSTADAVYGLMRASKVLALPSKREGFGMVVLEANAAGLGVVVADYPDNLATHLISPASGVITKPDAQAFADGLSEVLERDDVERRTGARQFAATYGWEVVARSYEDAIGASR